MNHIGRFFSAFGALFLTFNLALPVHAAPEKMKIGLVLIAMGFGYKIWIEASAQKRNTRVLGRAVAIVMLLASLCAVVCSFGACHKSYGGWKSRYMGGCPMGGGVGYTDGENAMSWSMLTCRAFLSTKPDSGIWG